MGRSGPSDIIGRRAAMYSLLTVLLLILVLFAATIGIGHLLWVGIAAVLGYQVRTVSRFQSRWDEQRRQSQSVEASLNELAEAGLIDKRTLYRVVEAMKLHRGSVKRFLEIKWATVRLDQRFYENF